MGNKSTLPQISIEKSKDSVNVFDIIFHHNNSQKNIEMEFGIYPYSPDITSDDFQVYPYEEYIKDINLNESTVYFKIEDNASKLLGLCISFLLFILFYFLAPQILFTIESLVSLLAVFFVSKDIWNEIETLLLDLTQNKRISYKSQQFHYKKTKINTLLKYFEYAREIRNQRKVILADKIDFQNQSNSKYLSISYTNPPETNNYEIFSMKINNKQLTKFENNYMFIVKYVKHNHLLFFKYADEYFQILQKGEIGIFKENKWIPKQIEKKRTFKFWRFKFYFKSKFETMKLIS